MPPDPPPLYLIVLFLEWLRHVVKFNLLVYCRQDLFYENGLLSHGKFLSFSDTRLKIRRLQDTFDSTREHKLNLKGIQNLNFNRDKVINLDIIIYNKLESVFCKSGHGIISTLRVIINETEMSILNLKIYI